MDLLGIVFRWMHLLAAITAVGGTVFMRLALLPASEKLADEPRRILHEEVRSLWARPIQLSILFLLVSGVYNTISVMTTYDVAKVGYYHPIFGVKFLLAFVVFFIASALTGKGAFTQRMRDNRKFWLTLNLALAVTIVCLSGILRKSDPPKKPVSASAAALQRATLEFRLQEVEAS